MCITAFIIFHTIIPISLQVTLEVVRFIQALFINWVSLFANNSPLPLPPPGRGRKRVIKPAKIAPIPPPLIKFISAKNMFLRKAVLR